VSLNPIVSFTVTGGVLMTDSWNPAPRTINAIIIPEVYVINTLL
jgi:hypothetical protein